MSFVALPAAAPRSRVPSPAFVRPSAFARVAASFPLDPLAAATLALVAMAGALPAPSFAQDVPGAADGPLEGPSSQQVTVTATRVPVAIADTVADITVLTREDLERDAGLTLGEVLATQPGVQLSSNGGRGTATAVFLRGMEARHTLLLLDGVRVDSATLGLPSFDNLSVALIDRVEIVRGPLSALYGADAAGGVVQVFTRRGGHGLSGRADLGAGSHGYLDAEAGVSAGGDGFDLAVDGSHVQDRGFSATNPKVPFGSYNPDRDGFDQNSGSARAGWQLSRDWRLEGLALQSAAFVHYDDGPDVDSRALLRNGVQALTLDGRALPGWRTTLKLSRAEDEYDTIASEFGGAGTISTIERRVSCQNDVDTPAGVASAVLDRTTQDVSMPGTNYDVTHRTIDGAALALNGHAQGHTWQASVRRDHNSQFGSQTTGGLAYAYAFTPAWQAGASYGTSFVAPSFNQLYYPGYGNPQLQPERGHSTELHLRWHDEAQELRLTAYRQRMRGYITPGADATNVGLASIDGWALAWERRWQAVAASVSFDHLAPIDEVDHTTLVRRAPNDAKALVDWDLGAYALGATWTAYAARRDTTYDANFDAVPVTLGAYATLDLRADWKIARDWKLGLRVNNATDKAYETAYGYNQPRREAYVVLSWRPH